MLDIQRNGNDIGSETKEFNFWDEKRTEKYENDAGINSPELEFQTKIKDCDVYSPTFWATSIRHETYNLLQHHSQSRTTTSRLQVMVDDGKTLTNMVQNMPESSFELSLRDIVDDQTNMHAGEKKIEKRVEKKKCSERNKIVRSQSLDSGVFLLKMFLPACLSTKKKSTAGNCSRASRRPSFDGSEKPMDKEWWSLMFLVSRKINSCSSSRSSDGGSQNRNGDGCYTPAYLSSGNLSKSRRHIWSIC